MGRFDSLKLVKHQLDLSGLVELLCYDKVHHILSLCYVLLCMHVKLSGTVMHVMSCLVVLLCITTLQYCSNIITHFITFQLKSSHFITLEHDFRLFSRIYDWFVHILSLFLQICAQFLHFSHGLVLDLIKYHHHHRIIASFLTDLCYFLTISSHFHHTITSSHHFITDLCSISPNLLILQDFEPHFGSLFVTDLQF